MKNIRKKLSPYIIVLGTTSSGSGVVYDYLTGRGDLYAPLQNEEYQLLQIPNGLMTLEAVTKFAFHPGLIDFHLNQFEFISNRLAQPKSIWRHGRNFSKNLKLYEQSIKEFVNEISLVNYPMDLEWHRFYQSPFQKIKKKLKKLLLIKENVPNTRLIVSSEKLVIAAQKLNDKIFQPDANDRPIILDQAGSGWNPVESTKYFSNRKIILMNRDPRDTFVEIKQKKGGKSIEGFIDWYSEMRSCLKKIKDSCLLQLQFEEFILDYKDVVNRLCIFLSLNLNVNSKYNPNLSLKNIGKYKSFLSNEEINKIENKLSEYLY